MPDDIGKTLIRGAQKWGATDLRIKHGGKHPRLVGSHNGVPFVFVFPGSSGDRRAERNCLSDLRGVLGVEREEKPERQSRRTVQRPRRAPPKPRQIAAPMTASRGEDRYYTPLARIREALAMGLAEDGESANGQMLALRTPFLGRRKRFLQT